MGATDVTESLFLVEVVDPPFAVDGSKAAVCWLSSAGAGTGSKALVSPSAGALSDAPHSAQNRLRLLFFASHTGHVRVAAMFDELMCVLQKILDQAVSLRKWGSTANASATPNFSITTRLTAST
jgi:hypothetical protein